MKSFVIISAVLGLALAKPSGLLYPAVRTDILHTLPIQSQFHAQDALGQYSYGYTDGLSAKQEIKSLDGVTRGSYSYIDAEGKLQTTDYTADALNGFRVAATNLPKAPQPLAAPELKSPEPIEDTPEVVVARTAHLEALEKAKAESSEAIVVAKSAEAESLPKPVEDTPEVAQAKAEHLETKKQAELRNSAIQTVQLSPVPLVKTVAIAPVAPLAKAVPLSPIYSSQAIIPGGFAYSSTQWTHPIYRTYYL